MTKCEAIERAGGASALAALLGITPAAVAQWGERVPRLRLYELKEKRPDWFAGASPGDESVAGISGKVRE